MTLQSKRHNKGWTQEHLAQLSGISVRTIQRLENGAPAGAETLQSLAAAFECDVSEFLGPDKPAMDPEYARHLRDFRANWISAAITIPCLAILSWVVTPGAGWIGYVMAGWGLAIALHAGLVFLVYRPAESGRE